MIFRNILIQLIFDLIEEITIRIRNRRIEREKIAADNVRLKKQTAQRIKEAKENFDKIDPSKCEVN